MLSLPEAKLWVRVDHDEEDALIMTLVEAATSYVKDAVGSSFDPDHPKAKVLAMAVVADWYVNRELTGKGVSDKMRPVFRSLVWQLRYAAPKEADTS